MTELNMYKEALSLQLNWMCIKKLHHGDKWTGAYKDTIGSKLASNRLHLSMINGSNKIDTYKNDRYWLHKHANAMVTFFILSAN